MNFHTASPISLRSLTSSALLFSIFIAYISCNTKKECSDIAHIR